MEGTKTIYYKHIGILLLLTLVVFFPLSLNLFPMKHDAIDCFFPWRYFISSEFHQGNFPYWNPYQDLGYPIHADPSSGTWYPIVWLFSLFGTYSVFTISIEYLLHVFLAGVGSYLLFSYFKFSPKVLLFGAIAYMLNGVFISNAQHLPYIVSACWLPYVIYYFLKIRDEVNYRNCVYAAFFLYLMITGGYPAFTIILFYLFLVFIVVGSISLIRQKDWKKWGYWMLRNFVFVLITILLSIGIFVSIFLVQPYLSRLGNFSVEEAVYSPFSIQSFISFVAPYTTAIRCKYELFNSDLSMRNGYFGLFPFVLFLAGIFLKKPKDIQLLFLFGFFALTAAVGDLLPVRSFLFHYVPMMNVFRFPSVFRAFFILSAILVGLNYLQQWNIDEVKKVKWLKRIFLFLGLFFLGAILFSRSKGYLNFKHFVANDLFLNEETVTIWQHLVVASIIQLLFVGLFIFVLIKRKDLLKWGVVFLVLDLFITIQLVSPFTVYGNEISGKAIQATFDKGERKFANTNDRISIKELDDRVGLGIPFWQNEATFQKHLASEGFNSFSFTSYEDLEDKYPNYLSQLLKNRNAILSDKIFNINQLNKKERANDFDSTDLFFSTKDINELNKLKHTSTDRLIVSSIRPSEFKMRAQSNAKQLLTLFQKNYKGWKAFIDGKETKIYTSSSNFMTIVLPKGKHSIQFKYFNKTVYFAFVTNLIVLGFVLFFILYQLIKYFKVETRKMKE